MDRAHDTGLNRSQVVQSLSHRSKAVRRAGCSGDNLVFLRQGFMVNVVYDSREVVTSRSGDNNFLSACSQMCRSFFFGSVETSAFENYVYIMLAPRNVFCILFSVDFDFFAVNGDAVFASLYLVSVLVLTLRGIILEQVCEHFRAREVVDCNYFITLCIEHLTESETANTAKTIDSNFYCHLKNTP